MDKGVDCVRLGGLEETYVAASVVAIVARRALHFTSLLCLSVLCKDPLVTENLVSFGFGLVDNRPGFEYVEMLIDVSLHLVPELFFEAMTFELSITL